MGVLPHIEERRMNFGLVKGSKYGAAAENLALLPSSLT